MRKGILALVAAAVGLSAAGVALAGAPATNPQGYFIDLSVKASPPIASKPGHPRGLAMQFDSFDGNRIDGNRQEVNPEIIARFGQGFTDNAADFPACKLNLTALSKCSKADVIGTGSAETSFPGHNGAPPSFVSADLVAYNGSKYHGQPTLIVQAVVGGKPVVELDFTVKNSSSGPWGVTFTSIPGPPGGTSVQINKFELNIPKKSRVVNGHRIYGITAPTTCHGFWQFQQENTFKSGPPLIATDTEPCTTA